MTTPNYLICILVALLGYSFTYANAANDSRSVPIDPPVSGRAASPESLLPADALARFLLLEQELGVIQQFMGKPQPLKVFLSVKDASTREVYFQARTVYQKSDKLAFEWNKKLVSPLEFSTSTEIQPYHVWVIVSKAHYRVDQVKDVLGITSTAVEIEQPIDTTPDDVFAASLRVSNLLSILLDVDVSPSDVYRQLNQSIYYMAGLLREYSLDSRIPEPADYVPNKKSRDVMARLLDCFHDLQAGSESMGVSTLKYEISDQRNRESTPGEVYGVATLMLSKIAYIHALKKIDQPALPDYYPGRKVPSDVFQRASVLCQQLAMFKVYRDQLQPTW